MKNFFKVALTSFVTLTMVFNTVQVKAESLELESIVEETINENVSEGKETPQLLDGATETAVLGLFIEPEYKIIKNNLSDQDFTDVQNLIDSLTDVTEQDRLNLIVKEAKNQFTALNMIVALFDGGAYLRVRDDIKHIEIEAAVDALDEVENVEAYDHFFVTLTEAYSQLSAQEGVKSLFAAPEYTNVRSDITDLEIEAAFDLVDEVTTPEIKKELMVRITEAYNQHTGRVKIKNFFSAPDYKEVRENLTHLEIEEAYDIIEEITDDLTVRHLQEKLLKHTINCQLVMRLRNYLSLQISQL